MQVSREESDNEERAARVAGAGRSIWAGNDETSLNDRDLPESSWKI